MSSKVRGGDAACQSQQPAALAPLPPHPISAVSRREKKGEAVRVIVR